MVWQDYISRTLQDTYEIRDYHLAATILANDFRGEFADVCRALEGFRITTSDILPPGGNESAIPKKFSSNAVDFQQDKVDCKTNYELRELLPLSDG